MKTTQKMVASPISLFCMLRSNEDLIVNTETVCKAIENFESYIYLAQLLDHNIIKKQRAISVTDFLQR